MQRFDSTVGRIDFYHRRDGLRWKAFQSRLNDDGSIIKEWPVSPAFWSSKKAAKIAYDMFEAYLTGRDRQRWTMRDWLPPVSNGEL